jgi:hypothetical protein
MKKENIMKLKNEEKVMDTRKNNSSKSRNYFGIFRIRILVQSQLNHRTGAVSADPFPIPYENKKLKTRRLEQEI